MKITNDLSGVDPVIVNVSDMMKVSWEDHKPWFNTSYQPRHINHFRRENPKKVLIAFNGPPSSGKTNFFAPVVDKLMWDNQFARPESFAFSDTIYRAVCTLYGLTDYEIKRIEKAGKKNTPLDVFFGKSLRQILIAISEDFLKTYHGDRKVIARMFARHLIRSVNLPSDENIVHILDTGFHDELEGYLEELKSNNFQYDHIMLFRLHREGCSFDGDSRSYITEDHVAEINRKVGLSIVDFDLENAPLDGNGCSDYTSDYTKDVMTKAVLSKLTDIVSALFVL